MILRLLKNLVCELKGLFGIGVASEYSTIQSRYRDTQIASSAAFWLEEIDD